MQQPRSAVHEARVSALAVFEAALQKADPSNDADGGSEEEQHWALGGESPPEPPSGGSLCGVVLPEAARELTPTQLAALCQADVAARTERLLGRHAVLALALPTSGTRALVQSPFFLFIFSYSQIMAYFNRNKNKRITKW
jgi:hypothetical protein